MLSDPDAEVVSDYGVWNLFQNELPAPSTFIIDTEGVIQWEYIGKNALSDRADNADIIAQLEQLS